MNEEGSKSNFNDVVEKLIGEAGKEPLLLHREESVVCPACGSASMTVEEYLYEVPYFEKIILSVGRCSTCGYHFRDVRVAEALNPRKLVVDISGEDALRMLVAKSPFSSVLVRELNVSMIPGPASIGFITTVEGLIERFIEVTSHACKDVEDEKSRASCEDTLNKLKLLKDGKIRATLVICDYDGMSRIVDGRGVSEQELDQECEALKPDWIPSLGQA